VTLCKNCVWALQRLKRLGYGAAFEAHRQLELDDEVPDPSKHDLFWICRNGEVHRGHYPLLLFEADAACPLFQYQED